jgi:hypothetical protein
VAIKTETSTASSPERRVRRSARCACPGCGVHIMMPAGDEAAGTCPNCGTYGLLLVNTVPLYHPELTSASCLRG